MTIPIEQFGRDHWLLLLYLETLAVDHPGDTPDPKRMRSNPETHPELNQQRPAPLQGRWMPTYITQLAAGHTAPDGHDDYDCMDDLEAAGLIIQGANFTRAFAFTDKGLTVVQALRLWKSQGKSFATFRVFK